MKKLTLLLGAAAAVASVVLLLMASIDAQAAKETPPAPYAGMKNPFPWSDGAAMDSGKKLYGQFCSGCHGDNGGGIPSANLSTADFSKNLEESPDFYFWLLSEGRLTKGMPPFKASFSEQQRWQLLTYMWSFSAPKAAPKPTQSPAAGQTGGNPTATPAPKEKNTVLLAFSNPGLVGEPVTLQAAVRNSNNQPVTDSQVQFFMKVDFFTSGLIQIGQATTDAKGIATAKFVPRENSDVQIIARSEDTEVTGTLTLEHASTPLYQAQAGLKMPSIPFGNHILESGQPQPETAIGTEAPVGTFRLPGGIFSWLLLIVFTVMLVWTTYFRVIYQIFRIPAKKDIRDTNTRLIPIVGFCFVTAVGIMLVLVLIHGPYTHLNLIP